MKYNHRLSDYMSMLIPILMLTTGLTARAETTRSDQTTDARSTASMLEAFGAEPFIPPVSGDEYVSGGGLQVTTEDWDRFLQLNPPYIYRTFSQREEAVAFVQDKMLNLLADKYFLEQAREMGLLVRTEIFDWFTQKKLFAQFLPTPKEVREHYDMHVEHYKLPVYLTFRQIFLKLKGQDETARKARRELALDLVGQLRVEPGRFSQLAREHSDSSMDSKDELLIKIDLKKFHPDLRGPLMEIEEGRFSDPLEGPDGLHIVWLEERTSGYMSLGEATELIRSEIVPPRIHEYLHVMFEMADTEFDLMLPPIPERLDPDTLIVGGAEEILGADVALAYGRPIEELNTPSEIITIFRSIQGISLALAIMRRNGWDKEVVCRQIRENMPKKLLWETYQERRIKAEGGITEDMIQTYYSDHAENYTAKMRCQIRECRLIPQRVSAEGHEIVAISEIQEKAVVIRKAWEDGADFESLIRNEPMATNREQGGLLHWVDEVMDTPVVRFEDVSHLDIGEVSQPKRLPRGYSLVQLLKREENVLKPLDRVRESIKVRVSQQLRDQYRAEFEEAVQRDVIWSIPDEVIDRHSEN